MLPRLITKLVGWAVAVFYAVERSGPALVPGPLLVTANHPNALVDPLVIFRTGGRPTRPLAKAPLFEQALVGTVLRGLGGLPVYRREDDPALMHQNQRTFDAAVEALHRGEAVQIYPEGQSHSEPSLSTLRTGAARIALQAESRTNWTLGVRIQPVGLTYSRKHRFRGRVVASFGTPVDVGAYRQAFEADPREAARLLTEEIRGRLEGLTVNVDDPDELELVDVAERLYARERRLARFRERVPLAERVPRMQRFATGLRWLRTYDPETYDRVHRAVRRYQRMLTLFGAREGDVPPEYGLAAVLRYGFGQAAFLLLVAPLALLGTAVWLPPLVSTRRVAPLFRPKLDQVATYKLGFAVLAFPAWWAMLSIGAYLLWGLLGALVAALVLPGLGLSAIAWSERQHQVRGDLRVFWRVVGNRRGRDRLGVLRTSLADDFDILRARWIDAGLGIDPLGREPPEPGPQDRGATAGPRPEPRGGPSR